MVTCTWGPSTIRGCASSVYGRTLVTIRRGLKKYALPSRFARPIIANQVQIFCQEAVVWKHLTHPNILPLLGVTVTPFQLISSWMSGGDLPYYLKENPDADRLGLVGVPSVAFIQCSLQVPVIRCRQRPLPPPFLQRDPWGPQGSMRLFLRLVLPQY